MQVVREVSLKVHRASCAPSFDHCKPLALTLLGHSQLVGRWYHNNSRGTGRTTYTSQTMALRCTSSTPRHLMRGFLRTPIFLLLLSNMQRAHGWGWLMISNWSSANFTLPCNSTCFRVQNENIGLQLSSYRCRGVEGCGRSNPDFARKGQ